MNPAEYKTARESLGLSCAFTAKRTGVSQGRIWAYESPERKLDVPANAAEVMQGLLVDFDASVALIRAEVEMMELDAIPRHVDLAEFEAIAPALIGWGHLAQSRVLAAVQLALQVPIEYAYTEGPAA